ncbi:MAG: MBL fold metallo-hydrolase [Anaeroplasmataceae bacterium]
MIVKYVSGNECGIRTNVYVVANDKNEAILIDTSYNFLNIYNQISEIYYIKAILITHAHIDHVDGLRFFKNTKVPIYMSKNSEDALYDYKASSYEFKNEKNPFKKGDLNIIHVRDGEDLDLIGYKVKILETKGHTNGSVSYVFSELESVFTGDTLFEGRHGMTTYYSGNHLDMLESMKKILSLGDNFIIYPGHYNKTTVNKMKFLLNMNIELFTQGKDFRVDTNDYLVSNGNDAIIFDTSFEFDKALEIINKRYKLRAIFITHSHMDHIDGLKYFIGSDIPIYMSKETEEQMYDKKITSYYMINENPPFKRGDLNIIHVTDNQIIDVIGFKVRVISTPGHQKGATSYNILNALFTGDTIFYDRHGSTAYPTGDAQDMKETLRKLLTLPEDYIIYPGHDDITTVLDSRYLLLE